MRIGNGASDQLQLDIYGEAMDAIFHADSRGLGMAHEGWMSLARITGWLCEHWDQPEEGIWETRGGRKCTVARAVAPPAGGTATPSSAPGAHSPSHPAL